MRITGGEYSGRIVKVPEGDLRIRPSMDRMRQSVFDVLGDLLGCGTDRTGESLLTGRAGAGR